MTARCKYCGTEVALTERESSQIAEDLDRRLSWAEQAKLVFLAVCADCVPKEAQRLLDTPARPRRVVFISASV